jgi:hypothetical protein
MSRKLILALAVLSLTFSGAAFAAVENIKVSGDVTVQAINRDLSLDGVDVGNLDAEEFVFSHIRLRFDADLTEGVSAVVRLISEEHWGANNVDDVEVDLAYIEMREFLYQPLTVIVGQQNLRYGNALIVGDPDTNRYSLDAGAFTAINGDLSLRKSFDAVRAILDYAPYTIDVVYAKHFENTTNIDDDRNLWGVNLNYQWASYNGVTEGYFWYVENNDWSFLGAPEHVFWVTQEAEDQAKTFVSGARIQYDPNDHWTLGLEGAFQWGDVLVAGVANNYQHLAAFAGQGFVEYRFLNDYNAKLGLEYTWLSGDDDVTDDRHTGWQPLFEDQTPAEIINLLYPQSGTQCITAKGSMMPREDITMGISYTWVGLTEKVNYDVAIPLHIPLFGPASANVYRIEGNKEYLGSEVDGFLLYDYTEDVQIKMTGAWFIPGSFYHSTNNDLAYSLRAGLTVDF